MFSFVVLYAISLYYTLRKSVGAKTHTLTEAQLPRILGEIRDIARQDSGTDITTTGVFTAGNWGGYQGYGNSSAGSRNDRIYLDFGSNQPHNNIQPSLALNNIIKT